VIAMTRSKRRLPLDVRGLTDKVDIFRVARGRKRDPAVETWLKGEPEDLRAIARTWFAQMRACGDDVGELMHDGCPIACIQDAPFAYVNSFTSHVNVGFFYGVMLDDPAGILEGTGKRMRHVKLRPGSAANTEALRDLINAAYADIKARLEGG
jgi:hypothetical protein